MDNVGEQGGVFVWAVLEEASNGRTPSLNLSPNRKSDNRCVQKMRQRLNDGTFARVANSFRVEHRAGAYARAKALKPLNGAARHR